jgi:hypothetical protein
MATRTPRSQLDQYRLPDLAVGELAFNKPIAATVA